MRRTRWLAVLVALVALGFFALRLLEQPMFEPGTMQARITARGESLDPAPTDPDAEHWQVTADVALHHDSFGAGPDVLFIHGGPGFPLRRRPAGLVALAESHRVHLFDVRGAGRSSRPIDRGDAGLAAIEDALGLAEQLADVERIRRRLDVERLILIGHSFGALVAALYAAELPERVERLLLVAPAPLEILPPPTTDLFGLIRARLPADEVADYDAYLGRYFDFGAVLSGDEASASRHYGELRRYYARATGVAPEPNDGDAGGFVTLATYASLGRRHDWRDALGRITAPTVVVHAAGDLVPESDTRRFAASIPGAEVRVVPGDHFGPLEDGAELRAALAR